MNNKMDKKMKLFISIIFIVAIILLIILGFKIFNKNETIQEPAIEEKIEEKDMQKPEKKEKVKEDIKIFKGDDRPIAFMIDNNVNAQPHSGLNKTYLVYEIIVEGGETRLMALFKGSDFSSNDFNVGPIRSARHYFIDYALENDAIYAHLGQSPQAEGYILNFNVSDINGQVYDTGKSKTNTSLYWREKSKKAPHNAYTSVGSILKICDKKDYKTKSNKDSVLNYVSKEVTLEESDKVANVVTIPYGPKHVVKYEYNPETKRYSRYSKGKKQVDEETGEDITTKNIIITKLKNITIDDGEGKGRQDLENFVTADGFYITNGKVIPIKCKKTAVGVQTKYEDLNGKKIEVNDGNTWINICPIDSDVVFE